MSSSLGEDRRRVGQHSALVVARAAAEHAEEARRLRSGLALALGPAREVEKLTWVSTMLRVGRSRYVEYSARALGPSGAPAGQLEARRRPAQ